MSAVEGNLRKVLEDAVEEELTLFGLDVVEAVVRYLDEKKINVDGDLRKSIIHEVAKENGLITVSIGPTVHYGLYVHEGTRPHWVPIDALRRWVKKKLGLDARKKPVEVSFTTKGGEHVRFTARVSPLEQAARAIQRKIARDGTTGKPYLSVPFELFRGTVAGRVGRRIEAALGGGGSAG